VKGEVCGSGHVSYAFRSRISAIKIRNDVFSGDREKRSNSYVVRACDSARCLNIVLTE